MIRKYHNNKLQTKTALSSPPEEHHLNQQGFFYLRAMVTMLEKKQRTLRNKDYTQKPYSQREPQKQIPNMNNKQQQG